MKKIFGMYAGLRKEIYILCFGRFVTAMGSLIWPMLTLILKSKLGFNAEEVAFWFLLFGFVDIPFKLLGGKVTDRFNKRDTILVCDLISVAMYVTTAFLPLSMGSLIVYFIGSAFQHMEWPAYDSMIAEMTSDDDRQKAYSLQYLASNLGVVFAPTLGGLLFNNYLWLSFLICGLAVLSSTVLIFLFIPKTFKKEVTTNTYEENEEGNVFQMLMGRKILLAYMVVSCVAHMIYAQFNYLLPIQMDDMFLENGAKFFGVMTSVNGAVVIIFTPLLTQLTLKWNDLKRVRWGIVIQSLTICMNYFYRDELFFYITTMVAFTIGEVLHTLGNSPYISKRIPSSHRGRFVSINNLATNFSSKLGNMMVGKIIVMYTFREGWIFVFGIGMLLIMGLGMFAKYDKKRFGLLYKS